MFNSMLLLDEHQVLQLKITGQAIADSIQIVSTATLKTIDTGYGFACEIVDILTSDRTIAEYRRYWKLAKLAMSILWGCLVIAKLYLDVFVERCEKPEICRKEPEETSGTKLILTTEPAIALLPPAPKKYRKPRTAKPKNAIASDKPKTNTKKPRSPKSTARST